MKIGIDAGGTLLKIVYVNGGQRRFEKRPSSHIDHLIDDLNNHHSQDQIYLTGGKAEYMSENLNQNAGISVEFDATYSGLMSLIEEQGLGLKRFVYLNVGTGTSFHQADHDGQKRVGGSGVGGGTLLGLSSLLTGISDFEEIVSLAKEGNRDEIDLKVHHIYAGRPTPIPGDLTASNFGNVLNHDNADLNDADKIQSVIALIAETVTAVGISLADGFETKDIVFIGSTLLNNEVMEKIILRYAGLKGADAHIIKNGEFSGAIGAIL
ncbi:type II pantothenate kinase [Salinicoccus albus]|uniref:type II pantothenate kinase n=1 Tax=Salinicoccus albus TaxID=418756 RepID=UPI000366C17C|nr:type II pantothenate kinase [Salinicoccus albus]